MSKQKRRRFTAEQKAGILRRHLKDRVPISDLCDEYKIQPSVFYGWQRQLLENLESALDAKEPAGRAISRMTELERENEAPQGEAGPQGQRDRRDLRGTRRPEKITWGALTGRWVPHDTRDEVVDFVVRWSELTEVPLNRLATWLGIGKKLFDCKRRYGQVNEHNAMVPRDHWTEDWERQAIIDYHDAHALEGYRRLTFVMLDADVVAVSPSTVCRVLKAAGRLDRWNRRPSKKGTGFRQPDGPHRHWHIDIAHVNVAGTFYYLCASIDGYSRFMVHWEIRESMKESRCRNDPAARPGAVPGCATSRDIG